MTVYLSVEQVLRLHHEQVATYGGGTGLRDRGSLESAVARPAMTFGGDDLYPDVPSKAAALMHSLVLNHHFVDGNKRVGAHAAIVFVLSNGCDCLATPEELVEVTLAVAEGKVEAEALAIWFRQRLRLVE
ncbi:MAG: type II toxin-antitoxin system death-on-curing family toxin [Bryobacteraceae bacterium]